MQPYEWRSEYAGMGIGGPATEAEIKAIETEFGWPIPLTVRIGLKRDYAASIFKGGEPATHVVSDSFARGGRTLAYFQSLNTPVEIVGDARSIRAWAANPSRSVMSKMIPIARGGMGEKLCLRYDLGSRREPEIWWLDAQQETAAEGLYKVADNFDAFIDRLITDDEYVRLGFQL